MDELDILKKDWKQQEASLPKLSYNEIYKMLWKKSSSIVKWIFIISILELLFWGVLNILLSDGEFWKRMEIIHLKEFTVGVYVLSYAVTFYFIYRFYQNYKKISSTDDAATLMKNILTTRKTVKYYVGFIIISTALTSLVYAYFTIFHHAATTEVTDPAKYSFSITQWLVLTSAIIFGLAIFLGALWLFYRLLYGILLNRLNKNYKDLKNLEE
ncbi:MAG: hypothetical protein RI572_01500 [Salegentibacter sp.]|uniref:Uncharacterized protein n=1 Tax=Salegentibacter flavus TaxID=287099 RepID=A0A1I4YNH6_9FLAO|nr:MULTISPECIES: hypothetical protein [Salegentibacter]MDR9456058.1 hypothetical protein [Salegentibacter sp.]SFN39588.1 hypothetical protein SAMN05660413_00882 [Salegentibacter flavus]